MMLQIVIEMQSLPSWWEISTLFSQLLIGQTREKISKVIEILNNTRLLIY